MEMKRGKVIVQNTPKRILRKKCPYSELFWSVFSRIQTEYRVSFHIQSKCRKIRTRITPNTDTFHAVEQKGH